MQFIPHLGEVGVFLQGYDKIIIIEFQSSPVYAKEKRRFRFYTTLFDHVEIKSKKPIEVNVLSTVEEKQTKWYNVSEESVFPIYIHSLKNYDGDEFLNKMNDKIVNNKEFSVKELLLISLSCFMKSENEIDDVIKTSAITITNIKDLNEDIGQFAKEVILMLCDKFVEDEIKNKSITNLVGGNMKNLEKYIERRVKDGIKKDWKT